MSYFLKHKIYYVNWREEAEYVNVSHEEWNKKYDELTYRRLPAKSKTIRKEWMTGKYYRVDHRGNWMQLYWNDPVKHKYYIWAANPYQENTEAPSKAGTKAMRIFTKLFQERNGDFTLKQAFGYSPEEVKYCIPKQFYFINPRYLNKEVKNLSSIDGTAMFLSNARGALPDWGTAKELEGTVLPTEEYPFAFYLKSGMIAEWNNFDSHDWLHDDFWNDKVFQIGKLKKQFNPEDDITVLCKTAKFELTETLEYFYNRRSDDPDAKHIVNRAIGFMHKKRYDSFKLAHIAAIAIARSNAMMLKIARKIGFNLIVQIAVDGILYRGRREYGQEKKEMGCFHQEFTDCTGYITGTNKYIVKDEDDEIVKVKHAGCQLNEDGTEIDESAIISIYDCKRWKPVEKLRVTSEDFEDE